MISEEVSWAQCDSQKRGSWGRKLDSCWEVVVCGCSCEGRQKGILEKREHSQKHVSFLWEQLGTTLSVVWPFGRSTI